MSILRAVDVVEPMPDDGDVAEITRQLELCVVGIRMCLSNCICVFKGKGKTPTPNQLSSLPSPS